MANNKNFAATKGIIPGRLSYAYIWSPHASMGGEEKFSTVVIVPKSDKKTIEKLERMVEAAKEEGKSKRWNGKIPAGLRNPIRDGDEERPDDENYANSVFITASSKDAPQIVDRKVEPIMDPMMVYSGCYCYVSVNAFPYNTNGNKGVGFGLGNIQLIKDGERLSGKAAASADFDVIEGDDEEQDLDLPDYLK